jgi:hypothetical protein
VSAPREHMPPALIDWVTPSRSNRTAGAQSARCQIGILLVRARNGGREDGQAWDNSVLLALACAGW